MFVGVDSEQETKDVNTAPSLDSNAPVVPTMTTQKVNLDTLGSNIYAICLLYSKYMFFFRR